MGIMRNKLKIRSLKVNASLNVIYTLLNAIFPLITYPYVSRVLQASGMGKVNFFVSVVNYATMLASLGINTYGIRLTANSRKSAVDLSKNVLSLLKINIISTVLVLLIYTGIAFSFKQFYQNIPLVIINGVWILSNPFGMEWLYQGLEQYSYITTRNIAFKLISLILIFIFVKDIHDYIVYSAILASATVGPFIINFCYAHTFINFKMFFSTRLDLGKHLKPMLTLFGSALAISVYTNLDTIMLGVIRDDREVGIYTLAVRVETVLLMVVNAISSSLLPRLSFYIHEKRYSEFNKVLRYSSSIIFMLTCSLTSFFIIVAKDTVLILGGRGFVDATFSMQLLMPILIISGFSNITGNQILIPMKKEKFFMIAVSCGACLDFLLNLWLMKPLGSIGASLATLIAELAQMSIQVFFSRNIIFNNIEWLSFLKNFLSVAAASIFTVFAKNLLSINPFLNLLCNALVFYSCFLLFLVVTREHNTVEVIKRLGNRSL